MPCAPSEGGAARDEVRVSGAQKSRVEIRACPRLSFRPPRVDAEAPRGPGRPQPWRATNSRAGGRKDGRESQSRESKGGDRRRGTLDPETQRGSDTEPLEAGVRPRSGSSLDAATAVGNGHVPFQRVRLLQDGTSGQSCLRLHVHIYRQKCPWREEAKENM